jgi:hypothetical protein
MRLTASRPPQRRNATYGFLCPFRCANNFVNDKAFAGWEVEEGAFSMDKSR